MTRPESDWYATLGVDPGATDAEIGRAFRNLARRYHPDSGPDPSSGQFADVSRAWEVLGDPASRADYDARRAAPSGAVRIPIRRRGAGPAGEAEVEAWISFAEAITGTVTKVALTSAAPCSRCGGEGRVSAGPCPACGGHGRDRRQTGTIAVTHVCPACHGSGAMAAEACRACHGKGWADQPRELSVKVPAGVADGTRLRLKWPATGQPAGYARVRIRPDEWFFKEDKDVVLRLPVSVAEAALGCTIEAALPHGPASIQVPPGTQPGDRIRGPGDLLLAVEVVVPRHPGPAETAALQALAAAGDDPRRGWPAAGGGGSR